MKPYLHRKYFESQEEDEVVIFTLRKHPLILSVPLIFTFCLFLLSAVLYFLMKNSALELFNINLEAFFAVALSIAMLYLILIGFISWLIRYLNIIILTNKHLVEIEQSSIFNRKISILALDHIEDVTSETKGFIRTIFDFGNIHIQTAGEVKNFELRNYKDPEGIEKKIMEAKEEHERSYHPAHHLNSKMG